MEVEHVDSFIREVREKIDELGSLLSELRRGKGSERREFEELIEGMIRNAHTIKGMASLAGFPKLTQAAHWLETILDMIRSGDLSVDDDLLAVVGDFIAAMDGLVRSIESFGDERGVELSHIIAKATRYLSDSTRKVGKLPSLASLSSKTYDVVVYFENSPEKIPTWLFAVVSKLQKVASIVESDPDISEVMGGKIQPPGSIRLRVETSMNPDDIREMILSSMDGVRKVEVSAGESEKKEHSKRILLRVYLEEEAPFKAARALLVLRDIEQTSKVLSVMPAREEIKEGILLEDRFFEVLVETEDPEAVKKVILEHPGVEKVDVSINTACIPAQSKGGSFPESFPSKKPSVFGGSNRKTISVDVSLLDGLLYSMGELIAVEEWLESLIASGPNPDELVRLNEKFKASLSRLRSLITSLRVVDLREKVNGFVPYVTKLAKEMGKEVDVIVRGENVAVDRSVAGVVWEALVHILRNAVIHGIEMPEERIRAGKPPAGVIEIEIFPHPDYIEVSVRDDGRGINIEEIKKRAVERGIITPEEAKKLSRKEALMLIFKPGISTADVISERSGRGFGLNVVMESIRELHGSVHVSSEEGRGTVMTLRVPADVLLLPVYIVEVGGKKYAIPSLGIAGRVKLKAESVRKVGGIYVAVAESGIFPAVLLHEIVEKFTLPPEGDLEGLLFQLDREGREKALVLVDSVLGRRDVVVRSLRSLVPFRDSLDRNVFTGVAILGGREPVPVIDLIRLMEGSLREED
ncbi:MAG: Hpt domain-containing protein [Thermococcus sp.]|nr:Hpt domain-containing protein [Thermococcus sp.]